MHTQAWVWASCRQHLSTFWILKKRWLSRDTSRLFTKFYSLRINSWQRFNISHIMRQGITLTLPLVICSLVIWCHFSKWIQSLLSRWCMSLPNVNCWQYEAVALSICKMKRNKLYSLQLNMHFTSCQLNTSWN